MLLSTAFSTHRAYWRTLENVNCACTYTTRTFSVGQYEEAMWFGLIGNLLLLVFNPTKRISCGMHVRRWIVAIVTQFSACLINKFECFMISQTRRNIYSWLTRDSFPRSVVCGRYPFHQCDIHKMYFLSKVDVACAKTTISSDTLDKNTSANSCPPGWKGDTLSPT